jgi:ketosteroid isomerase-like protein
MSRQNVELVLSAYRALQQGDYAASMAAADPEIVWDMSRFGLPDLAKVYRGHDGVTEFWTSWLGAWESIEFTELSAEDHGDRVLVEVRQRNRGRGSGIPVDFHYFQVTTVQDGRATHSVATESRDEALELLAREA